MADEIDIIHDSHGQPRLMVLTDGRIVNFRGSSVGFLDFTNVYNYKGNHCGWYEGGILRDHDGNCVGFGELISDAVHPPFPAKKVRPIPSLVEVELPRPGIKINPPAPQKSANWSTYTLIALFLQTPQG